MINDYLTQSENKTLEFKENTKSLPGIIKTIVAFANTSGGVLIIGIKDKTKEIIGVTNAFLEEERIANAVNDSIAPLIIPDIEIHTYRDRELIIIRVPHTAGPFYLKTEGLEKGVHVRFGSTNRLADREMLAALKLFSENRTFDELPVPKGTIDEDAVETAFLSANKKLKKEHYELLNIITPYMGKNTPTVGGILLFSKERFKLFPDATIRCARFKGNTKENILDQKEITSFLSVSVSDILLFIERNTSLKGEIGIIHRRNISEYPPVALREAIINAILHSDYSIKGCHIQIAIFDDRIEITNPGGLPFGQTIQKALAGFSKLRNRVIGRVFRELNLIEQWGSGLQRIFAVCKEEGLKPPIIEEHNNQFRITLYSERIKQRQFLDWEKTLINFLKKKGSITTKTSAEIWNVTDRTARTRLKSMVESNIIQRIATSEKDPLAIYKLKK